MLASEVRSLRTEELIALRAEVTKYSDDQPRDEAGRWASDGGTPGAPGLQAVWDAAYRPIDAAATAELQAHGYAGADIALNGDPGMVKRTVEAYKRLAEQFPKTAAAIKAITVRPPSLKVLEGMSNAGIAATSGDGRTVMINPYWMTHPDEYDKVNQQAIATGWFTPGTAKLEGVIAHEFGHTIFAQEPGASELLIDLTVRGMTHDLGDYVPSGYAGTDVQEWWAEMVSQAINEPREAQSVPVREVASYLQNLSEQEKGSADIVKFDPSQPRDEAGRWTATASEVGGLPGATEYNEARANRFVNYPANEYNGVQLHMHAGIEVWPSALEQVRPDNFAALSTALLRLHDQFPDVKVTELSATPFSDPATLAQAHRTGDGDAIWLSSRWWSGDLPAGAAGWHPEGTGNATGYITHEFGHALDRNLLRATPGFIGSEVADSYRAWRQDFATDKARWPGGYGQTNVMEAMADLFAATYTPGATREPESANLEQALAGNYKAAPEPVLQLSKFDPSQPRDEAGRWTAGGSAASLDRLGMETVAPGARFKPEGIAPEYHPMIREVLKEFAARFPGVASRGGGVKVWASSQLAPDSQAETLGNTVRLSKTWYNTPASAWPTEEFTARFSVDPSARGTLVHELGHVVDADGGMADGSYYPSMDLYEQVGEGEPISGYSLTSPMENFAESFAAWWDGKYTDSPQVQAVEGFIADRYPDAITKADTISPLVFSDEMRRLLVEAYKEAFTAGWDDTDTETDLADNTIDDMLEQEVPDLNQTITSVAALLIGGAVSGPMLVARLGQWAASLNAIYEKGFAGGVGTMGDVTRVTWVTEEDGIVCPLCDDRDGRTWLSGERHPYPGEGYYGAICEGGPNCRCSLTYELVAEVAEDAGDESAYDEPYDTIDAAAVPDLTILSVPELLRMRAALKYDESEPRDDHGRWTTEGGGPTGPLPIPESGSATGFPEPYNPNAVSLPLSKDDKLFWVAASRERLAAIRDNAGVSGTIGNAMLKDIAYGEPKTEPLYRGVRLLNDLSATSRADDPPRFVSGYLTGDFRPNTVIDLPLSSFSGSKEEALLYARADTPDRNGRYNDDGEPVPATDAFRGDPERTSVLIRIEPGAQTASIGSTFGGTTVDEQVTAGRFLVKEVSTNEETVSSYDKTWSGPVRTVVLQQIGVIDPDTGYNISKAARIKRIPLREMRFDPAFAEATLGRDEPVAKAALPDLSAYGTAELLALRAFAAA